VGVLWETCASAGDRDAARAAEVRQGSDGAGSGGPGRSDRAVAEPDVWGNRGEAFATVPGRVLFSDQRA